MSDTDDMMHLQAPRLYLTETTCLAVQYRSGGSWIPRDWMDFADELLAEPDGRVWHSQLQMFLDDGDWIVRYKLGKYEIVPDSLFKAVFKLAE